MIRVGIGGWTFAPWRGTFFAKGLPQAQELRYASRQLSAIEINGTFYRMQSPGSFRKWAAETPDGFVFTVKGHRFVTNRKVLAEAGPAIEAFLGSGVLELGEKLGPINWQLAPTKRFEPEDMEAFLRLLPPERGGRRLRHAVEARHASFATPAFVEMARRHGVAIVFADHDSYPAIPDVTADFVYARLQRCRLSEPEGYPAAELGRWAEAARSWQRGEPPAGVPSLAPSAPSAPSAPLAPLAPSPVADVFVFFIAGDKERAPAAATGLIGRL